MFHPVKGILLGNLNDELVWSMERLPAPTFTAPSFLNLDQLTEFMAYYEEDPSILREVQFKDTGYVEQRRLDIKQLARIGLSAYLGKLLYYSPVEGSA